MAKHTAVNWILIELQNKFPKEIGNAYEANQFLFEYLFEKAKAMEKDQICEAWQHGKQQTFLGLGKVLTSEEYYNETYKKK